MSMLETSEIDLMIGDKLLAEVNSEVYSLSCSIDFFLEDMIETRLGFAFNLDLLLKFLHRESSILIKLDQ
jgi:hypothetical protein